MDIVEFLTARYAEEAKRWQTIWRFKAGDRRIDGWWDLGGTLGYAVSDIIDTTRGGRGLATKREHLVMYQRNRQQLRDLLDAIHAATDEQELVRLNADWREACGAQGAIERVLYLDATPYADHPDYNPEWRIDG